MVPIHPYIPQTFHLGYLLYVRTLRGLRLDFLGRTENFLGWEIGVKLASSAPKNLLALARF
jgi:hypothetical protein